MRRISIIGNTGAGKTTLARALADRLGVPHVELDALYHQADWVPRERDELHAELESALEAPGWVVDGNYVSEGVGELVWPRADTVVWLDLSRAVVMPRIVWRTLRRAITREELWNGNREPMSNLYSTDPDHNIVLWAWTFHEAKRHTYERCGLDGTWSHADVYRLQTPREVERFLATIRTPASA